MNERLQSGMREASRLTRAGRLTEATALLQRVLHSGKDPYSASGNADVPPTIDLVADTVEVTGAGPSLRSGQEFGASARSVVETGVRAYLPEALRHSFDRITRTGFEHGLGGLALWRMSGHPAVQQALRNHYFDSLGLPRLHVSAPA